MKPAPIDPPEIHQQLWHGYHGRVGYDIGANCGQSLSEMTKRFLTVFAFEPAEECADALEYWAGSGVTVLPIAVTDTDGDINLLALPDKIDTGQLVTQGTHGMEWDTEVPTAMLRTVNGRTIDSLVEEIPPPSFMKIDVEGHEMYVLAGASHTLVDYAPDLLIEFHTPKLHDEIIEFLEDHDYPEPVTVRHPHYRAGSSMWFQHGWIRAFAAVDR